MNTTTKRTWKDAAVDIAWNIFIDEVQPYYTNRRAIGMTRNDLCVTINVTNILSLNATDYGSHLWVSDSFDYEEFKTHFLRHIRDCEAYWKLIHGNIVDAEFRYHKRIGNL